MQLTSVRKGTQLRVKLCGEMDHHNAACLRGDLDNMLTDGVKELVLDMSAVTFMDSSGIGVILGRYRKMNERGGRLSICGASKYAQRILRMSGILSLTENR